MLSQSGAFMITRISQNPWLDPRYMLALGNQTDLTHGDMLAWFAELPEIETIGIYIEGFKDGDGLDFARAVRKAVRNGKQVVVYKSGKTARQLRLLSDALDSGRLGPVRRLVNTLSPAEIGNLLESLPPGKRTVVWGLVDPEDDGEVLVHVGDEVREGLIADMDPDELVAAVEDLDIDDLADLVEDLPDTVIDEVLKSMDRENRERLEQVLSYDEDSAGRLMNPDVVTVRADTTVDVVLRYLRLRGELPEHTDHIYVVSKRHQYLGRIALQAESDELRGHREWLASIRANAPADATHEAEQQLTRADREIDDLFARIDKTDKS